MPNRFTTTILLAALLGAPAGAGRPAARDVPEGPRSPASPRVQDGGGEGCHRAPAGARAEGREHAQRRIEERGRDGRHVRRDDARRHGRARRPGMRRFLRERHEVHGDVERLRRHGPAAVPHAWREPLQERRHREAWRRHAHPGDRGGEGPRRREHEPREL